MNIAGSFDVAAAVVDLTGQPSPTLAITPGAGNTITVEVSLTPGAAKNPGAANWHAADTANFLHTLTLPITAAFLSNFRGVCSAMRFTRTAGVATANWEIST